MPTTYTVLGNIEQPDFEISRHRSLSGAGRSYQAAHTGSLRRVVDAARNDVTREACDAAGGER